MCPRHCVADLTHGVQGECNNDKVRFFAYKQFEVRKIAMLLRGSGQNRRCCTTLTA